MYYELDDKINRIKNEIIRTSTKEIYNNFLISGEVWFLKELFKDDWYNKYEELKLIISNQLDVHFHDIAVVGSGKLGFSLNPQKNFKKFDNNSDIDILIISKTYFDDFWREYLKENYSPAHNENIKYVYSCIFQKYISLEFLSKKNAYYKEWQRKTKGFQKNIQLQFNINNEINYLIFESWDAAEMYYSYGIELCKKNLERENYI